MKRQNINQRRNYFVIMLCHFLSLIDALEATSKKFNVSISTLRMDWSRRDRWPQEILEDINNCNMSGIYKKEICRTLVRAEVLISTSQNESCVLGAMKLKVQTLEKLIALEASQKWKEISKKVEALEKRLQENGFFEKQGDVVDE